MNVAIELFIIGVAASFGSCLAFCSPVILPYIGATRHGWREGLKVTLVFLFSRLVVYCLLGLLAGMLGWLVSQWLQQFGHFVFLGGGLFISVLGLLIILGKEPGHHLCHVLKENLVDSGTKGPLLLGLILGILPCPPLLGALAYIALKTQDLWHGAFYGLAFGMGKFVSPLIPLGVLASVLPERLIKNQKIYGFFSRLCGFILFLIGINLMISMVLR